jgi:transcriptional regulator with XRE-family HTH domain
MPVRNRKTPRTRPWQPIYRAEALAIGRVIAAARGLRGLSQGELGAALTRPRTHGTISHIEGAVTSLTVDDLLDIARVLGVDAAALLRGELQATTT